MILSFSILYTDLSPVSAQVVSMFSSVLSTTVPSFVNNLRDIKSFMNTWNVTFPADLNILADSISLRHSVSS